MLCCPLAMTTPAPPQGCCTSLVRHHHHHPHVHDSSRSQRAPRLLPRAHTLSRQPQPSRSPSSDAALAPLLVQPASPSQFWVAADVHCRVFHEEQQGGMFPASSQLAGLAVPQELLGVGPFFDRVDRAACLHALDNHAKTGAGNCTLLLAYERTDSQPQPQPLPLPLQRSSSAPSPSQPHVVDSSPSVQRPALSPPNANTLVLKSILQHIQHNPLLTMLLDNMLNGNLGQGVGVGAEEEHLLGICIVDSFGHHVPARALDIKRQGSSRWCKRTGVAYISNVCVLPSARGRGIARRLVEEAEGLARSWGCRAVGLHCNQKNIPAVGLYRSMGYKKTVLEPAIMPYLHGRPPERCHFFLRRLPSI